MLRARAGVAELRAGCCLMMSSTERKLVLSSSFQLSPEMAATPLFVSIRPQLQPVIPVCIQICPELVFTGAEGSVVVESCRSKIFISHEAGRVMREKTQCQQLSEPLPKNASTLTQQLYGTRTHSNNPMKSTPTNQEVHNQSSKFDIDILEEASYVLWYIWREKYARYATLASCIEALAGDGELYEALKTARRRRRYDVIRNWSTSRRLF